MTELERCELAKERGYTYDPISGNLFGVKGKVITRKVKGYIIFEIGKENKKYSIYAHRQAWYLHYGKLPNNLIDHINGDKANNKISNLRDVTKQQNNWNTHKSKGYTWNKGNKKFEAFINLKGKRIYLGLFKTTDEAHNAYLQAKKIYHPIPN